MLAYIACSFTMQLSENLASRKTEMLGFTSYALFCTSLREPLWKRLSVVLHQQPMASNLPLMAHCTCLTLVLMVPLSYTQQLARSCQKLAVWALAMASSNIHKALLLTPQATYTWLIWATTVSRSLQLTEFSC